MRKNHEPEDVEAQVTKRVARNPECHLDIEEPFGAAQREAVFPGMGPKNTRTSKRTLKQYPKPEPVYYETQ